MWVVILAGGRGTRLGEDSVTRPKPMVDIGGRPILWHIMQIYSHYGHKDFLIACGYKGEIIKEYFYNYVLHSSDYLIDLSDGSRAVINSHDVDWRVGVIDTGLDTATGGRLLRLESWLGGGPFMVTYGDGVADVDVRALVAFHRRHGKLATVTAVRPPSRFGTLRLQDDRVAEFTEKPPAGEDWINGGFFVFEPAVLEYIRGDQTILEREVLERLAVDQELMAFRHDGFWQPMDTQREKEILQSLWASGAAPWCKAPGHPSPLPVSGAKLPWRERTA